MCVCVFLKSVLKTTMNCFFKVKQHNGITIVEKSEGECVNEWVEIYEEQRKTLALEEEREEDREKEREKSRFVCLCICASVAMKQYKTKQKFKILKYCNYMSKWKCNQAMRNLIRLQWSNHSSNFTGWKFWNQKVIL